MWTLAAAQHGVVARRQLVDLGVSGSAIHHRLTIGQLHPVWQGVYAVGRPELTFKGWLMAAVLACGPDAVVSHMTAAMLLGIRPIRNGAIHISVPEDRRPAPRDGIVVHRRTLTAGETMLRDGIPVVTPVVALVDLAATESRSRIERAIGEADKLGLTDPEQLRAELDEMPRRPGRARMRAILDRRTFVLTQSELERRLVPIATTAGLGKPQTGVELHGFVVDFYWPELGLVVETDGLTYHRTPAAQARDRIRDQALTAAGLTVLRFTNEQIRYQPNYVEARLRQVGRRRAA